GDEPMQAALAPQAQAFLSRDPEGPGRVGQDPSMSTQIPGENGNGHDAPPAIFGAATPAAAQPVPAFTPPKTVAANEATEPVPDSKPKSFANAIGAPITLETSPTDRDASRSSAKNDSNRESIAQKTEQLAPPVAYASVADSTP